MYRLIPAVLSLLLLGAHFLRANQLALTAICAIAIILLLIKRAWVIALQQIILFIGSGIWISVTYQIWVQRGLLGEPRLRMALILGGVAVFTLISALILQSPVVQKRFQS